MPHCTYIHTYICTHSVSYVAPQCSTIHNTHTRYKNSLTTLYLQRKIIKFDVHFFKATAIIINHPVSVQKVNKSSIGAISDKGLAQRIRLVMSFSSRRPYNRIEADATQIAIFLARSFIYVALLLGQQSASQGRKFVCMHLDISLTEFLYRSPALLILLYWGVGRRCRLKTKSSSIWEIIVLLSSSNKPKIFAFFVAIFSTVQAVLDVASTYAYTTGLNPFTCPPFLFKLYGHFK